MSIDRLAIMVQKGFVGLENKIDKKIDDFRIDITQRLEHIEQVILDDHRERINRLEDQVKELQADFRALVGKK